LCRSRSLRAASASVSRSIMPILYTHGYNSAISQLTPALSGGKIPESAGTRRRHNPIRFAAVFSRWYREVLAVFYCAVHQ
jgi:hypothetical protein